MSVKIIESKKVGKKVVLTNKCTLVSTHIHEVYVGSGYCTQQCEWFGSKTPISVNCKFRRTW